MNEEIIFFNTGWMEFYNGVTNDKITGGGKYIKEKGWGHEIYNFQIDNGKCYGYVQPKSNKERDYKGTIKIEKLNASVKDAYIDDVLVVWVASRPVIGGTYIVGWYSNARIFRHEQPGDTIPNRNFDNKYLGYYTAAKKDDCTLLPEDERTFQIPRRQEGGIGQSNVWYAFTNPELAINVKDYIFKVIRNKQTIAGLPRQSDPFKRIEVEDKAIEVVTSYYSCLGYTIKSVEKDNVGWDLYATNGKLSLKLEVKGLSGDTLLTELTPNEYKNLKNDLNFYRLCIVTKALMDPKLRIFSFSMERGQWVANDGKILKFQEIISARVFMD